MIIQIFKQILLTINDFDLVGVTPWSLGVTPWSIGATPWSIPFRLKYIYFSVCTKFHPLKIKILKKFFWILNADKKF